MEPGKDKYRLLIENLPDAFAYHRMLFDEEGNPVDFDFLEVNKAYEEMIGFSREEVIGKKVTQVLPEIKESRFDWINTYGKVVLTGETIYFEQYFEPFQRYCQVTAYKEKDNCFCVIINDIKDTKEKDEKIKKLEENNKLLQGVFESIQEGISVLSKDLTICQVNDNIKKWHGEDVIGKKCYQAYQNREKPCSNCPTLRSSKSGKMEKEEVFVQTAQGEKWIEVFSYPLVDSQTKEINGIVEFVRDITDRKQAEEALQQAHHRLTTVIDSMDAVVYIADMESYEILFINEYVRRVKGDIVGQTCWKAIQGQEGPCSFCTNDKLVDKDGNPTGVFAWEVQNKLNGRWYDCRDRAVRWLDGRLVRMEIATDITDRKQAEKEREELSAEYETVFQGSQDSMFLIEVVDDEIFRFIRNNQAHAQATGLKTEDFRGKTPQDVLGEKTGTSIVENYNRCVQEKKPIKYEETLDLPGGKRTWSTVLTPVIKDENVSYIVGSARDITDRKQNEEALAMQNTLLKTQQEVSLDGILVVDADDRIISFNQRFADIWGIPDDIMALQSGEKVLNYVLPMLTDPEKFVERINELYKNKQEKSYEEIFLKDGRVLERYSAPVIGDNEHYYGRVWYYRDITERKKAEGKIKYLSFHDSLTGLYNRAYLEEEMQRLDTERQLPISIIMVDLNGLKLVNDVYGHKTGDEMLKSAAEIIKKSCRREDIVGRWGGDEFVILLPQTPVEEVETINKRIRNNCRGFNVKGVPVSLAAGSGTKESRKKNLEAVLKEAEDSMYRQKLAEQKSVRGSVLNTLLKALKAKSYETEEHTMRMVSLACKIGEKIGLADTELNRLKLVINLHDIGKINIPETTLTKEGSLTDEEWEIIKTHPEVGYRITRASEEYAHVSEDLLAHHERWDGRGYPRGLKEKEIPLLARITAIVDAYDVMSNGRPYKKPMSQEEIIAEMRRCVGTQFDPELLEIFLSIIEE